MFHNRIEETVPDAMHTIKDVIENFFYLNVGRDNFNKPMVSEAELQQLGSSNSTEGIPYRIHNEQKKLANLRACSILCPEHVDFVSHAFFTKTHFKSHDWKQVFSLCLSPLDFIISSCLGSGSGHFELLCMWNA